MTEEPAIDCLLEALGGVAGPDTVQTQPDVAVAGCRPSLWVRPTSADAAAACLGVASRHSATVVPFGGGTLQRIGAPPERIDVILDCSRLQGVVDWEPADLTAGVLAGTSLAEAQAQLTEQGQQIAIDAPADGHATIGGLVAANVCGPRRWLYGGWRDQIIGMEMALTSGELIKSGGRVVKNVQGYDLAKLFTGALGTLGVITRVNVRLSPLPEARLLLVVPGDATQLDALLDETAASPLRLAALDVLDAAAAAACGLGGATGVALLLIEGSRAFVDGQTARVARMARAGGLAAEAIESPALSPIYARWINLGRLDDLEGHEAVLRTRTLPTQAMDTMQAVQAAADRVELACRCWAHAGNGIISARLAGQGDGFASALAALQEGLLTQHAVTTLACGDPAVEQSVRPWGAEPEGLELMRRLKQRFDPTRTLQPGRYVGGM